MNSRYSYKPMHFRTLPRSCIKRVLNHVIAQRDSNPGIQNPVTAQKDNCGTVQDRSGVSVSDPQGTLIIKGTPTRGGGKKLWMVQESAKFSNVLCYPSLCVALCSVAAFSVLMLCFLGDYLFIFAISVL